MYNEQLRARIYHVLTKVKPIWHPSTAEFFITWIPLLHGFLLWGLARMRNLMNLEKLRQLAYSNSRMYRFIWMLDVEFSLTMGDNFAEMRSRGLHLSGCPFRPPKLFKYLRIANRKKDIALCILLGNIVVRTLKVSTTYIPSAWSHTQVSHRIWPTPVSCFLQIYFQISRDMTKVGCI